MLSVNGVVVLDIATFLLTEAIALLPVIFLSMLRAARWHRIMIRREDARSVGNGVMATFGTLFLVLIGIWLFDGNSEPSKIVAIIFFWLTILHGLIAVSTALKISVVFGGGF